MGKRASVAGGKATIASSPAKKQKADFEKDHLLEATKPVLKVLKSSMEAAAAEMLCAGLPFAIKVPEGAGPRHKHQEIVLDSVSTQLSAAAMGCEKIVEALQKEAADLETEKAQSVSIQEGIASRLLEKAKERDDAQVTQQSCEKAQVEATSSLDAAKEKVAAGDGEKVALEHVRDDWVAGLAELWAPLKASEFGGSKWRLRDKVLARLGEKLEEVGAEKSLLAGLPVALKDNVEKRSEFAQITIARGEEVYAKHLEELKEKVENFGAEISARSAAVTEAEAALKAAEEASNTAIEASIVAQNAWAEETNVERAHNKKMCQFDPMTLKLEKKLAKAQTELAHLKQVISDFESLRPVDAALKTASGAREDVEEKAAGDEEMVTEEPAPQENA